MFTLVENPEFTHNVTVSMPVDGGFTEHTFTARFKLLPVEDFEKSPVSMSFSSANAEFLRKAIVKLEGITDAEDKEIPYSHEMRDRVLNAPPAQMALMRTYLDAISRVKQGN